MEAEITPLGDEEGFCFDCSPAAPCFNRCCRDLVQAVTPYDALRLARGLGLSVEAFRARYCRLHPGPATGLPVLTLDSPGGRCPFVSEAGCRVYADRPSSCRAYPLLRAAGLPEGGGPVREAWFVLREPHCLGFRSGRRWTAAAWGEAQGLTEYNRENDRLLRLLRAKRLLHPGPLPAGLASRIARALYEPAALRRELETGAIPGAAEILDRHPGALAGEGLPLLHAGIAAAEALLQGGIP
ncbi:MAG: YkgJ family cysteine cluster protein [Desulfobacterales bacterium]